MIKICSLNSSMLYMKIELLNFCEGHSYFLWNRDWVPVIKSHCEQFETVDKVSEDKQIVKGQVTYSFITGCALKSLFWASSLSILLLSSISLRISSSCLTRLSKWNGSGCVHCLGSGFGGT